MTNPIAFDDIARLPVPDDNIAIATRRLEAGTQIQHGDDVLTLSHTVLLGHRFAIQPIAVGESLTSWGQTFGIAIKPIAPGDYVCNDTVLTELNRRSLSIELPAEANFKNDLEHYQFNEATFQPSPALPLFDEMRTFMGYQRLGGRGVGTRNTIILLGTTSLTSGFVRQLEARFKDISQTYPNVDGVVAIAHTEGGHGRPNNEDMMLRTLAGFAVHPNVAAVLIVDRGDEAVNNQTLLNYIRAHDYPLDAVPHHLMSLTHAFADDIATAEAVVKGWLPEANSLERTQQPLSALKIALQCGGSDAFSGVSGNPLASWVAKQVIQYGGAANLAETDELIGAETYVLDKVRDAATAKKFLGMIDRFKERVAWHGQTADGNPSGGNKYRGLYNIYLKSLGAATKRHPDVRLDYAIDYSEPMQASGFYFMDSPGNDLESIAGQVASGCNMIFFVTGNGSITNFPFVPTVKIITTSERFELLSNDMDINAGEYLDGKPLDELGAEMLDYTVDVASGMLSVGEKAGHSQVQLWRDWPQTHPVELKPLQMVEASGQPISINTNITVPNVTLPVYDNHGVTATDQVGLILPTSLCSGQIARMCAELLNKNSLLANSGLSRFVTLVHTEGCGGSITDEFRSTLLGYLGHPFARHTLLLEHGCESTHNDFFRQAMIARGYDPADFGWASIQLDGGIQTVIHKMVDWFSEQIEDDPVPRKTEAGLEAVRLALITRDTPPEASATAFADLTRMIVAAGGTVVINEQDPLLKTVFAQQIALPSGTHPSLSYAQTIKQPGFHLMAMPTRDWGEMLTGLGASGVEVILGYSEGQLMPGHPMIPMLQASSRNNDEDITLTDDALANTENLLDLLVETLAQRYVPKVVQSGNVYFQVTRGLLGVSL